jgi:hypothetical protein
MKDCASGAKEKISPFSEILEHLGGHADHIRYCVEVATANFHREMRLDRWEADVLDAIAKVDAAVAALPTWMLSAENPPGSSAAPNEVELLTSLSEAGGRLKEVFSGKGYFHDVNAD